MNSNSANTFLHISSSYESLPKPSFSDHDIELMTLTIRDFLEIPQIDPPIISLGTVCEKSLECGAIDMKPPLTLRLHNILENSFQSGNNLTLPAIRSLHFNLIDSHIAAATRAFYEHKHILCVNNISIWLLLKYHKSIIYIYMCC